MNLSDSERNVYGISTSPASSCRARKAVVKLRKRESATMSRWNNGEVKILLKIFFIFFDVKMWKKGEMEILLCAMREESRRKRGKLLGMSTFFSRFFSLCYLRSYHPSSLLCYLDSMSKMCIYSSIQNPWESGGEEEQCSSHNSELKLKYEKVRCILNARRGWSEISEREC